MLSITERSAKFFAWINGIETSVLSRIFYPYKYFVVADGLMVTALVLLVTHSLPPYVTSVPIYNCETCVILHSTHPRLSISTWMQLSQDVCHVNDCFLLDFPQYWSTSVTTLSMLNFIILVPGYGRGMAKFLVRLFLIRTLFWHCLMKLKKYF